ncbi:hypothetical protein GCM10027360_29140 [Amycolatopsis echigonensis]
MTTVQKDAPFRMPGLARRTPRSVLSGSADVSVRMLGWTAVRVARSGVAGAWWGASVSVRVLGWTAARVARSGVAGVLGWMELGVRSLFVVRHCEGGPARWQYLGGVPSRMVAQVARFGVERPSDRVRAVAAGLRGSVR